MNALYILRLVIFVVELSNQRIVAKITLCGSYGVGKTSVRRKFMGESFIQDHLSTLGADFSVNRVDLGDGTVIELQIWDLAGQQGFENLRQRFFKGTSAAIMVFDISKKETFDELDSWFEQLWRSQESKEMPIAIIGNKVDLNIINVTEDEVQKYIEELKQKNDIKNSQYSYFTTSAKTGVNIQECFMTIAKSLYEELKD